MKPKINKMIDLDIRDFNGTIDALLKLFINKAKSESWSDEEINSVVAEATKNDDYDHLVETIREYCKH